MTPGIIQTGEMEWQFDGWCCESCRESFMRGDRIYQVRRVWADGCVAWYWLCRSCRDALLTVSALKSPSDEGL